LEIKKPTLRTIRIGFLILLLIKYYAETKTLMSESNVLRQQQKEIDDITRNLKFFITSVILIFLILDNISRK